MNFLYYQDSCFEIREQFTTKLHKALDSLKLPLDYYAFLVLAAVDVSKERKIKVCSFTGVGFQDNSVFISSNSSCPTIKCFGICFMLSSTLVIEAVLGHYQDQ